MAPESSESERGRLIRAQLSPLLAAYYASMNPIPLTERLAKLVEHFSQMAEQAGPNPPDRPHPTE